jgi:hypothetical protein
MSIYIYIRTTFLISGIHLTYTFVILDTKRKQHNFFENFKILT